MHSLDWRVSPVFYLRDHLHLDEERELTGEEQSGIGVYMPLSKNLPEEVLSEILSWLPVKSLLRFRCVSKTWRQWISFDSRFMKLHFERSKHKNPGVIISRTKGLERTRFYCVQDCTSRDDAICIEIPFDLKNNLAASYDFVFADACNGLVCLTDDYESGGLNVYVWNPLTADHIIVPVPPFPSQFCGEWAEGYPDSGVDTIYGFGFHQGSNEYKVLRLVSVEIVHANRQFESDVSVYTLGTDSWRSLGDIMDYNINLGQSDTALVNGALHWFAPKARPSVIFDVLVAFDLQGESFREIPQPQYVKIDGAASTVADEEEEVHCNYSVRELGGLLCILRSVSDQKMQIWMLKEYGVVDSWSKQFNVETSEIPLGVANNEEIVLIKGQSHLILYNPRTNSARSVYYFGFQVYERKSFIGSLFSPTVINKSKH